MLMDKKDNVLNIKTKKKVTKKKVTKKKVAKKKIENKVQAGQESLVQIQASEPPKVNAMEHKLESIKKSDKVIILGFAPDTRNLAPVDDDSFDVWPLNELYMEMPILLTRATGWFQLHGTEPTQIRDVRQKENLGKLPCPVFMWKKHPDIENSVEYPLAEILKEFDTYGEGMAPDIPEERDRAYFTNSISWMLAMAIHLKYKEIHIYGVNMAQDNPMHSEFSHQRPSCEYFLGVARGRGIKLYLPPESDLLTSWMLYGYDDTSKYMKKQYARDKELDQRIAHHENQRIQHANAAQQNVDAINQLKGAKENTKYMISLGPVGVTTHVQGDKKISQIPRSRS